MVIIKEKSEHEKKFTSQKNSETNRGPSKKKFNIWTNLSTWLSFGTYKTKIQPKLIFANPKL
jgi:hypothetical protein